MLTLTSANVKLKPSQQGRRPLNFPFEEVRVIKKEVITLMLFTIIANCLGNLGSDIVRSAYRAITRSCQHNQRALRLSERLGIAAPQLCYQAESRSFFGSHSFEAIFRKAHGQTLPPRQRPPGSVA